MPEIALLLDPLITSPPAFESMEVEAGTIQPSPEKAKSPLAVKSKFASKAI